LFYLLELSEELGTVGSNKKIELSYPEDFMRELAETFLNSPAIMF